MSNSGKVDKAKSKSYYKNSKKSDHKQATLTADLKGFLCTCNDRQVDCVRESYNILNKYADILYGQNKSEGPVLEANSEDIEDELKRELATLKSTNDKNKFRFNSLKTGANNVIFISTTLNNPVELAYKIVADISETKQQQTRFLLRLTPIEITCRASLEAVEKAFAPLAETYFKEVPRSFSVVYNHRFNNSLNKDAVIEMVAKKVMSMRDDNKVSLKEAEVSVVIEVVKGIAMIGVVPHYLKYKKYNLLELAKDEVSKQEDKTTLDAKTKPGLEKKTETVEQEDKPKEETMEEEPAEEEPSVS